jgi:hypothetical protein
MTSTIRSLAPTFTPASTLTYCEVCGTAKLFHPEDVVRFATVGWEVCCGETVTLISGAEYEAKCGRGFAARGTNSYDA